MCLPFLISVPHAGLETPREVKDICMLEEQAIMDDSDGGAAEIYFPLRPHVPALVSTDVARAVVDMNRAEDDRRKDGIVKTHTCWDVPVYKEPLTEDIIRVLIKKYYCPYHVELSRWAGQVKMGIDCHTMAAVGPPVGPDPGQKRPPVCLSNGEGTCPQDWLKSLAECFEKAFDREVSLNHPFKGGYIVRSHAMEMPWVQVELSREPFISNEEKSDGVFQALRTWCANTIAGW